MKIKKLRRKFNDVDFLNNLFYYLYLACGNAISSEISKTKNISTVVDSKSVKRAYRRKDFVWSLIEAKNIIINNENKRK